MFLLKLIGFLTLLCLSTMTFAEPLTIAVASNFGSTIKQLKTEFEVQTSHSLRLVFGASGRLYAQINQGAPFDVFLSADADKPKALEEQGLSVMGTRKNYALGRLVLWSGRGNLRVDDKTLGVGQFKYLAIANDKHAPYGVAAIQVLKNLKVFTALKSTLVRGENISQTYQFVKTKNADLGLVALSQIPKPLLDTGHTWLVPSSLHDDISQEMVLLKRAQNNPAALAFLRFMDTEEAKAIIRNHGYSIKE